MRRTFRGMTFIFRKMWFLNSHHQGSSEEDFLEGEINAARKLGMKIPVSTSVQQKPIPQALAQNIGIHQFIPEELIASALNLSKLCKLEIDFMITESFSHKKSNGR